MKRSYFVSALLLLIVSLSSCTTIMVTRMLNSREARYIEYTNGTKTLRYIPMIHVSQPEFYQDVVSKIDSFQKEGYVLFYEEVSMKNEPDSMMQKFRKIMGFIPNKDGYKEKLKPLLERGYVVQNNDTFLRRTNAPDIRADVSVSDMITHFETLYGTIELTETDRTTPLKESVPSNYSKKQRNSLILDYRNQVLSHMLDTTRFDKILLLYGALHEKGVFQEMKKKNPNWKEVKK